MDGRNAANYILQNNIEGCFVECGVDAGYFEEEWIKELQDHNTIRDIYMFDTFA
jgi:hypothetical protein